MDQGFSMHFNALKERKQIEETLSQCNKKLWKNKILTQPLMCWKSLEPAVLAVLWNIYLKKEFKTNQEIEAIIQ